MPRSSPFEPTRDAPPAESEGLGLSQLAGLLRRSWRWIVIPTALVTIGAIAFVQVVSPRYTGEAKILLESRDTPYTRTAQERGEQTQPIDEQAVASQVQVVMSRDLAREAIRRLSLAGNAEFDPGVSGFGPLQRALMMIGLAKNPMERPPEERMLETYFDRLTVYPAGKSRILTVEFRSKDPHLAAQAANTIAELYIASLDAAKTDTARYASTWLGGNIETLRTRVADAEAKVETYRASHGLIATGGAAGQPLGAQQLGELSTQLSQARTAKADLAGRAKLIKEMIKDGRAFEIPDVANNEIIRRTVEQRITLRNQLALESRTLLPAHPRIKELTAQISDLDAQIKATAERVVRTLENDARIAEARVESLSAAVDAQRDVVSKGNSSEVQLRALEREAKAQREQLESYLARYREASARDAESAAPADARVVSRAITPETPSFPKKLPIVLLAAVLGLLFATGGVIARHLLGDPDGPGRRRRREEETETGAERPAYHHQPFAFPEASLAMARQGDAAGAPLKAAARPVPAAATPEAATVRPTLAPVRAEATTAAPEAATADAGAYALEALIARLRTGAGPALSGEGRAVLVVEAVPAKRSEAGLAVSLGGSLAAGAHVVVVDLNGPACGAEDVGLTDLVAGEAAFADVIQSIPGSRLHAIPRGFVDAAILAEEPQALAITLDALAQAYDWVVCRLGTPQVQTARDILAVAGGRMDTVVLASDRNPEDSDLLDLYALAEASGAAQVLVAQDQAAASLAPEAPAFSEDAMPLRRSAA
ncbi:lipopolysaccharide biosynthesis protein [Methylobacterium sp. Leaf104]|uniref:exopolysaccharide transport family protein n=1 Tax=Methylobacterium TaxID=407 RepID=UPI0007007DA7|nr:MULTISPECIES: exopolysaccharide transport family protein [Methylobacterium]KQP41317.1 lipopolysaccharide biosynthesis protein [Methylobacterium sp. Leaf104]MCI9879287.1 lipopolysaccharide biosynthesis protein [Methylobacterium goesingense]